MNGFVYRSTRFPNDLDRVSGVVRTPWGDSESLRDRQLHPVRGAPAAEVEQSQRERLFAAMVAVASQKGYATTTVNDLVELSGVSSRTFYDMFGSKQGCFVATLEAMIGMAERFASSQAREAPASGPDWEEAARQGFVGFAEMISAQPAAARLALIESDAAGPAAVKLIDDATGVFEALAREVVRRSPDRAGMPAEMITAHVGAMREVAATRLRRGTASELPGQMDVIWEMIRSYRPPSEPLRLSVRIRKGGSESLEGSNHVERAIRAFSVLVEERGYHATTVDEVVRKAGMSARTFYTNFSGKDDLMGSAIDSACAQAVAAVMPAFSRHKHWPDGIRAGFGALLGFLASRPALARLVTVDIYAAGTTAIERRNAALESLGALLENNTAEWALTPPVFFEVIAGGIFYVLRVTARDSGTDALPALAPLLSYLTLSPFIGPSAASVVANAAGGGRAGSGVPGLRSESLGLSQTSFRSPLIRALAQIRRREMSAAEIAEEIDVDPADVGNLFRELIAIGYIEEISGDPPRYRAEDAISKVEMFNEQRYSRLNPAEREEISRTLWGRIATDMEAALARGPVEEQIGWQSRCPLRLDQAGWKELRELHDRTLIESFEIHARSARRLADSGESPTSACSVQIIYELEPEGKGDKSRASGDGG